MTPEELQELKEKAELWDSLGKPLMDMYGNVLGGATTIRNTSNASSHIEVLEEESKEMVKISKDGVIENNVKTFVYDDEIGKCNCGADGKELHTCPFAEEIHDSPALCNCCKNCTHQCAMDI